MHKLTWTIGNPAPVWMLDTMARLMSTSTVWDWVTKPYDLGCAVYGMAPFLYRNNVFAAEPRIREFMLTLRADADKQKLPVGCTGFCWGGHHCVVLSRGPFVSSPLNKEGERSLIDAAFTAHPSFLKIPQDFEGVTIPLSIAWGDKDMAVSVQKQEEAKEMLKKAKCEAELKLYVGGGHGFGVRADHGNKEVERMAREAEEQAIAWFKKHFNQVKI
jgi:dienelactone hydrolase